MWQKLRLLQERRMTMAKKLARIVLSIVGIFAGFGICAGVFTALTSMHIEVSALPAWVSPLAFALSSVLFGIIFFIIAPIIISKMGKLIAHIEDRLAKLSIGEISIGLVGLIIGLLISFLLTGLINNIPSTVIKVTVNVLIYATCTILCVNIAIKRKGEMNFQGLFKKDGLTKPSVDHPKPLVLDTSVIIDGRIYDICKTGIIDTTLIIPEFVLVELRHIADSSDDLKRSRGRRGLDILNMIQKDLTVPVIIKHVDYDDHIEVDSKLLKLAAEINGKIATNDFNLNKVATVQGVEVININDLANAVKPIALPGEKMEVTIIKQGKEPTQGVAYLDDGTMIVVEDANGKVGQNLDVMVTSVLQTSAGRMIFARVAKS
jgi:uncharacterized protein YacL